MQQARTLFQKHCEREATRLTLKFLREGGHEGAYRLLQESSGVQLEDQFLMDLRRLLVDEGDFEGAEQLLERSHRDNLFSEHIRNSAYSPEWRRVECREQGPFIPNVSFGAHPQVGC